MDPLESFASWLVFEVFGIGSQTQLGSSLTYFIYDTIKVFLLLCAMVFLVSILRTFITKKKIRKFLGGKKEGIGNLLAALLGIPTPFCSCSAVPIFIGFMEAGVPLGITFSFLIASPMINEIALALLFGLFGWKVAFLYIASGLAIAIIAGIIIGRMGLEKEVEKISTAGSSKWFREKKMKWKDRIEFAKAQTHAIVAKVAPYLIGGIAIGALIHGYAPENFLSEIAGKDSLLAVPLAVLIGIPLYSNTAGILPVVQALIGKGMALGTALAFMMSVTAISLPEMVILRRVLKPKLIAIFAGVLFIAIVITGFLFNALIG